MAPGDIPVGDYDPNRLSNLGLSHGAIDAGGGYKRRSRKHRHADQAFRNEVKPFELISSLP